MEGSTILEPWRKDSTHGAEKLHATLQSVRRYAFVRVIPADGGYLLQVAVHKQLEDVVQPEHSTVGRVLLLPLRRQDLSLACYFSERELLLLSLWAAAMTMIY